ncbi:hypothetical protein K503DRAFT_767787 [Rhizopogon vinicolor AM-OR11-026]|uniref:Uncharacterized protein n=1 Tax=Rhizopogon vinicolor AM-OR11-026 TaxID=1314800 RepID=A0A1B7N8Y4_9AGAM|nr:hypothetical protein K503DRAFT_767787 [Rhizopogon vinicolor AM-OR11-026]
MSLIASGSLKATWQCWPLVLVLSRRRSASYVAVMVFGNVSEKNLVVWKACRFIVNAETVFWLFVMPRHQGLY